MRAVKFVASAAAPRKKSVDSLAHRHDMWHAREIVRRALCGAARCDARDGIRGVAAADRGSQPLAVAVDTAGDVVAAGDGTLADVEGERCLPSAQGAQHRHDNMRVGKMRAR